LFIYKVINFGIKARSLFSVTTNGTGTHALNIFINDESSDVDEWIGALVKYGLSLTQLNEIYLKSICYKNVS
jgi:hypothetical protein